ncbi:MAG: DUF2515 family protein [Bacillota bacterium]|nr:DUF2515 family protein [Bacillota bacterium]
MEFIWRFYKDIFQMPLSKSLLELKKDLKNTSVKKRTLTSDEHKLVNQIKEKTKKFNRNNLTRTKAYLDFYNNHPEIHWSFLAHMVSRNGGWNMTDLKGEFLAKLMSMKDRITFFSFIERANWLIFKDAFPQLLLYEETLKRHKDLTHLISHFDVSRFMESIWKHFLHFNDSAILTLGLIINEQNYIEKRIVQHNEMKKEVFGTLEFLLQDLLSLNQILFPYDNNGLVKLAGLTVHHFESLHTRIQIGKKLYSVLFSDGSVSLQVHNWAKRNPHTGSRKDYWPLLFNVVNESVPSNNYLQRLSSCQLRTGSPRFFSPTLEFAWKDTVQNSAEIGDWYKDWQVIEYLEFMEEPVKDEIQGEYCRTLERLELAAMAKKVISIFD